MTEASNALAAWSNIVQTPDLVSYFQGLFDTVEVTVAETGEQFTVAHTGDEILFSPGPNPDARFHVTVTQQNVANLIAHAQDGKLDPWESWRIVQVMFTPITQAALQQPVFSSQWLRAISGVEPLIHVYLDDPSDSESIAHTLAYAGDQWLVLPGLYGNAKRVFHLNPEQALEFQRRLYGAMQADSWRTWWEFASWYKEWRESVSQHA